MRKIVVNIPENEYRFFMKVIRNFPFAKIDEKKSRLLEIESKLTPSKKHLFRMKA
jgi:ribosomal protein S4E